MNISRLRKAIALNVGVVNLAVRLSGTARDGTAMCVLDGLANSDENVVARLVK